MWKENGNSLSAVQITWAAIPMGRCRCAACRHLLLSWLFELRGQAGSSKALPHPKADIWTRSDESSRENTKFFAVAIRPGVAEQVSWRHLHCKLLKRDKLNPTQSGRWFYLNTGNVLWLFKKCKQMFMGTHPEGYRTRWLLRRIFVQPISQGCQNTLPMTNQANF